MEILLGQIRISKGVTLVELERRTGISKSTLNNYENGKTVPDLFKLEKIAIALDVKITELFESEWK
ncbi:MAG: helix-turn-helix transcriptional regulator [Lachnospiraceae bacterium]|nr:helix-turn-helix transcriptional regulator [Lachnospiraceae bacterium]